MPRTVCPDFGSVAFPLVWAAVFTLNLLAALLGAAAWSQEYAAGTEAGAAILDATPRELPWFNTHCVSLADTYVPRVKRICRVNLFRPLGAVNGRRLYFALYRRLVVLPRDKIQAGADHLQAGSVVDKPPFTNTAVVIFEEAREPGKVRPILADVNEGYLGNEWFAEPRILERDGKQLLVISRAVYRAPTEERYYAFENGAWVPAERGAR